MSNLSFAVQGPGTGPVILGAYRQLVSSVPFDRVSGMYAFATHKGAALLIDTLSAAAHWRTLQKRWLISIDDGITEPDALRLLLDLPRSEVRILDAEDLLTRRLVPSRRFHPKSMLLEHRRPDLQPVGLLVSSANLTFNGLCVGHEHAMYVHETGTRVAAATIAALAAGVASIDTAFGDATLIDDAFVRRYEAIRPARPQTPAEPEDARADLVFNERPELPLSQAAALAAADNLWIDIEYVVQNRGRGVEGNQIDMQRGTRVFFGFRDTALPRNSPIGTVQISYGTHLAHRNLRFGNNSMDKLDLPIPDLEGPSTYQGTTLLFRRLGHGVFGLSVGKPATVREWKSRSRALGTAFQMRSGREFGVF